MTHHKNIGFKQRSVYQKVVKTAWLISFCWIFLIFANLWFVQKQTKTQIWTCNFYHSGKSLQWFREIIAIVHPCHCNHLPNSSQSFFQIIAIIFLTHRIYSQNEPDNMENQPWKPCFFIKTLKIHVRFLSVILSGFFSVFLTFLLYFLKPLQWNFF